MSEKILAILYRLSRALRPSRLLPAVVVLVIVSLLATLFNYWPGGERAFSRLIINPAYAQENFEVSATDSDAAGIDSQSAFIVKSKIPITDPLQLKSNLKIIPAVEFDLEKLSDYEFRVKPKAGLAERKIYRLLITSAFINENGLQADHDFSWAFQVKDQFKVLHTLPDNQATEVPVNTGIEVTFSNENFINFETAFRLEPEVPGRFEKHGRTGVFIPLKPLAPGKIYTAIVKPEVKIAESAEQLPAEYSFKFETAFDRPAKPAAYINFNQNDYQFSTKIAPAFNVYINNQFAGNRVQVSLYNYPDRESFLAELKKIYDLPDWSFYRQQLKDQRQTAGLTKAADYEINLISQDYSHYLSLPEALPAGLYLLEARLDTAVSYVMLQITDISAYVQINRDKILFWSNSAANNEPLAGSQIINLSSRATLSADDNGLATAVNPGAKEYGVDYYEISHQGRFLIMPVFYRGGYYDSPHNRYWNYLYTDRALYQPNDTINLWGLVKPRQNSLARPAEVKISLESYNFRDYFDEPIALLNQSLAVNDQGVFSGQLELKHLLPGSYNLIVRLNGEKEILRNSFIRVETYEKPAYEIIITPRKKVFFAGEEAIYDIKTQFFDGTPVADIALRYTHRGSGNEQQENTVKTDRQGSATLSFKTSWPDCTDNCGASYNDYLSLSPVRGEMGEIIGQAGVTVFGPKIIFSQAVAEKIRGEAKAKLKLEAKYVDLEKAENNFMGVPADNLPITAKITRIDYLAVQDSTYYDFINKVSYPKYRYTVDRVSLPDVSLVTDQQGQAAGEFNLEANKSYEIKFFSRDRDGKVVTGYAYVYGGDDYYDNPLYENYFLRAKDDHNNNYQIGERVSLELLKNKQPVEGGRLLVTSHQLGLVGYGTQPGAEINFIFDDSAIPNLSVRAVWYDGKTYHEAGDYNAFLKRETRELKIELKADKAGYAPKDEATLEIRTTTADKRPVRAEVNLNIVDAAFVSLGGASQADPLSLYNPVDSGFLYSLFSHRLPGINGGAEKGGGGEARSYFPDVALFKNLTTDQNGWARLSFKLPDSITSWQITAQAISEDLYAGTGQLAIKASLPFFVQPAIASEYLTADQPLIRANAYGQDLLRESEVKIWAEADSLGLKKTEVTTPAFTPAYFPLDKLSPGTHQITIGGNFLGHEDKVISRTAVVAGRLSEVKRNFYELAPETKIAGAENGWTKLTFMDYGRGRYYYQLSGLTAAGGNRVDQKLIARLAYDLIKKYYPAESGQEPGFDLTVYQDNNGGIKLLPYGAAELELSAKVAAVAAGSFDRGSLAGYFYNNLNNSTNREEAIWSIYGLASLGEPVLLLIRDYAGLSDLKPLEEIYLALAAENIGDESLARQLYRDLLTKYGEASQPYQRIKFDEKNNDNNIRATALVAVLGAGLGDQAAGDFWSYVQDNQPLDWLLNLEEVDYLTKLLPRLPAGGVKFSLTLDGRTEEKELARDQTFSLMLQTEQLQNLKWAIGAGKIGLVSEFDQAPADATLKNKYLEINKKYLVNGRETTEFADGDIVEIRLYPKLTSQALKGNYEITDILPSGLKLISNLYARGLEFGCSTWYPNQVSGQRVSFTLWQGWETYGCNRGEYFRYYARAAAPGVYQVEPALIQAEKSPAMRSYGLYGKINITK